MLTHLAVGCASVPLEQQRWLEVKTPNFTIVSNRDRAATVLAAERLEIFRTLLLSLSASFERPSPVPTDVYLLGAATYSKFRPRSGVEGYFLGGRSSNHVVVNASSLSVGTLPVLYHEYVHFVLHNQTQIWFPLWFHEGLAQVMSTMRFVGDDIDIGGLPAGQRPIDRWKLSLRDILSANSLADRSDASIGAFYSLSWLVVHYFMIGNEQLLRALPDYFRRTSQGQSPADACQGAFGMSVEELQRQVTAYGRNMYTRRTPASAWLQPMDLEAQPLPAADAMTRLAALELARGPTRTASATSILDAAIRVAPDHARAHALLGVAYFRAGRDDGASSLRRGMALAPDDPEILVRYGTALLDGIETGSADSALQYFDRAIALRPNMPAAYAGRARALLAEQADAAAVLDALETAHRLSPWHPGTRLMLAQVLMQSGQAARARGLLVALIASTHDTGLRQFAEGLLAKIDVPATGTPPATER